VLISLWWSQIKPPQSQWNDFKIQFFYPTKRLPWGRDNY